MENTLYIGLSRQLASKQRMNIIANNLANGLSPGYKGEKLMFVEYLSKPKGADRLGKLSFVQDIAVARNMREGDVTETGNDLDFAIHGSGWFVVATAAGQRYTRNGHFRLNEEGQLVTGAGDPVHGRRGEPIVFQPGDTRIVVKGDGTVTADGQDRGRIRLVNFSNEQTLRKVSGNLYRSDVQPIEELDASIIQGALEKSNVQPILEITAMIDALRSYQGTQKLIENEHDRQRSAIEKLTRER